MSKAEEFIKRQSHIIENPTSVWISSYNARKAVEIAREEMVEKVTNYLNSKLYDWVQISHFGRREYPDTIMKRDFIDDLKQAMKDESSRRIITE